MAFLDFLINEGEIQDQRRRSNRVAREQFDPNILNPQLEQASQMATEGIADEEIRGRALERILNQGTTDPSQISREFGSGRALSFLDRMNQQRSQQLGQIETQIGLAEEEARRQGEAQEAQIRTQQGQIANQRDAQIQRNRIRAEAEIQKRKQQLGAQVGQLAGQVAGTALGGPLGGAAGGAIAGGLFGGGDAAVSGAVTGGGVGLRQQQLQDILGQGQEGGQGQEQDQGFDLLGFIQDRIGGEDGNERTQQDLEFISRILGGQGFPSGIDRGI